MSAPVTFTPDFGDTGPGLVDILWDEMPWENRPGAPRYEAWMNDFNAPYTYGTGEFARTYEAIPEWHATTDFIRASLDVQFGTAFNCCFVNGYAHGRQHLGWHADDSREMDMNHPIAVVSFGAARDIWFRRKPRFAGDRSADVSAQTLTSGSLLMMHAGMQRDWQHRIPKSPVADCGRRVSLTFRRLLA